jgi:tRNA-binding protein
VINRQIGKLMSQVLTLGFPTEDGSVVLVVPDKAAPNGGKLF